MAETGGKNPCKYFNPLFSFELHLGELLIVLQEGMFETLFCCNSFGGIKSQHGQQKVWELLNKNVLFAKTGTMRLIHLGSGRGPVVFLGENLVERPRLQFADMTELA